MKLHQRWVGFSSGNRFWHSRLRAKNNKVPQLGLKKCCVFALAGVCALCSALPSAAFAMTQDAAPAAATSAPATAPSSTQAPANKPAPEKDPPPASASTPTEGPAHDTPSQAVPAAAKSSGQKPASKTAHPATPAKKPATSTAHSTAAKRRRRPMSPRVRRIREAFVASENLRTMAQQLVQDRTPAAYTGVEAYARAHSKEDAGALAWLVVGYAHVIDKEYAKAVEPLNRAKPLAGDLGDYVAYYLGTCYLQTGHQAEGMAALANFRTTYPDSLLVRDADLSYANALLAEKRTSEAIELLEKDRLPTRSDIELAIGKTYAAMKEYPKAAIALANVYYEMPLSPEADAANDELKKLPAQRQTRAELLMKGKRYNEAVDEYRQQAIHATPETRAVAELALADALYRSGRHREARAELTTLPNATPDQAAQRLYILAQVAWAVGENDTFYHTVDDLRQSAPTSPWLEQSLLLVANLHLVHHEYDQALDAFRECQQRFPNGTRASYAHWKAAWLTFRLGRNEEAKKEFEEQVAIYPNGNETSAALYWRARMAEEDKQPAMARAFYKKLSSRYRNYYYAELGRERLKKLPEGDDTPGEYPLLDRVPPLDHAEKVTLEEAPADDLHLQKAKLLGNGGLVDFAVRELQAAAVDDKGNWELAETAQIYTDTGHYDRALQVMKRSVPSYFAVDIPMLPREYWEALFPRPYWSDLKKFSIANGLDPYLVASLIRQESEFNPVAVSRANAVGLMQLLPRTGKLVAKQESLKRYQPSQLYTPTVNLELGTRYFKGMVDQFGGSFEHALAAYNEGSDRVEEWMGQGPYRDSPEFVESIPFTETREYVQAIMRNASVYRQLYGTP
jgi:soluble lytic murein transglycosylase